MLTPASSSGLKNIGMLGGGKWVEKRPLKTLSKRDLRLLVKRERSLPVQGGASFLAKKENKIYSNEGGGWSRSVQRGEGIERGLSHEIARARPEHSQKPLSMARQGDRNFVP